MDDGLLAEFQRQISKVVTVGVVSEVAGNRVRVGIGRNFTPLIPFMAMRAGGVRVYCPPSVGEQVVVFSACGSYENAVAGPSLFSEAVVEPGEGKALVIDAYGTVIRVDESGVSITGGRISVVGDVSVEGDVSVSGDVVAGGVSLTGHVHGGVKGGGEMTGAPE